MVRVVDKEKVRSTARWSLFFHKAGLDPTDMEVQLSDEGWKIPYPNPLTGKPMEAPDGQPYYRVEPFKSKSEQNPQETEASGDYLYCCSAAYERLCDNAKTPLYITEDEKQSVRATKEGLTAVGWPGMWRWLVDYSFSLKRREEFHPDFRMIPNLAGREVVVIANHESKDSYGKFKCLEKLALGLSWHGVRLFYFWVPAIQKDRNNGLDEYLNYLAGALPDEEVEETPVEGCWDDSDAWDDWDNKPNRCDIENFKKQIYKRSSRVSLDLTNSQILELNVTASADFLKREISLPRMYLRPCLAEASLNMIFGQAGVGKTWFTLSVGMALTRINHQEMKIGDWRVETPAGVCYIDGEMHLAYLQERLKRLAGPLGPEDPQNPFSILSSSEIYQRHSQQLSLVDTEWRNALSEFLSKHDKYKIVILDNLACLFSRVNENQKQDWDPINNWLLSLRHMGKTVILIHHAGKDDDAGPRGSSSRIDNLDNVIQVSKPKAAKYQNTSAIEIKFKKSRNMRPEDTKPFIFKIVDHPEYPGCLKWGTEDKTDQDDKKAEENPFKKPEKVKELLLKGTRNKDIEAITGYSKGRISQIQDEMIAGGILEAKSGRKDNPGAESVDPPAGNNSAV